MGRWYPRKQNPEEIKRHFAADFVRNWCQKDHAYQLTQRLHSSPKRCVLGFEIVLALCVRKTNVIDKTLIRDDVA